MDTDTISEVDLHASLEMSLNLLRNQYKNRIEIHKEYGDIPKIQGYSGKLNQVFMNLLSNAFHAVQGMAMSGYGRAATTAMWKSKLKTAAWASQRTSQPHF